MGFPRQKRLEIWIGKSQGSAIPAPNPSLHPAPVHESLPTPGTGALGRPWRDQAPTGPHWCRVSMGRPRIGAAREQPPPAHAAHNDTQAARYRADSNFPFYLLVQGESESLTGPQTSCQELLIRAERHKECTRPPAWELAGQSAEMESDRLKEGSLLLGGGGGGQGAAATARGEPGLHRNSERDENTGPDPLCLRTPLCLLLLTSQTVR